MTTYHINKAGKKAVCGATVRPCRYASTPHTTDDNEVKDVTSLLNKMDSLGAGPKPLAFAVEEGVLPHPMDGVQPPTKFLSSYSAALSFEFEDDDPYYGPSDYSELSQDVREVDLRGLLSSVHGNSYIPDEYVAYAKENGWDNPDNFEVSRRWGYYEEIEVEIDLKPELFEKIQAHYYSSPVAEDPEGILVYARGKGLDTTGHSPVEALKALLKSENGGKDHPRVDAATAVRRQSIRLDDIRIPSQRHYDTVEPRKPEPADKRNGPIAGVVFEENGKYSLVDGYHRTKWLRKKLRKSATYLVLSNTEKAL